MRLNTNSFIFNSHNSLSDFGVGVQEYPNIPFINENYEEYQVEGRSGSLIINKGTYNNREISFKLVLVDFNKNTFYEKMDLVSEWLTSFTDNKLFYDRQDKYFVVKKVLLKDIKRQAMYSEGEFEVTFLCEPFMTDLNENILNITSDTNIDILASVPIPLDIRAYGTGDINISIGDSHMQIKNVVKFVDIDSKLLEVRDNDGNSKDLESFGDFFNFKNGDNNIKISSNIEKLEIRYKNLYK
ncbi:MAG: distal tail protein Dit [Clostridium sp.]|uniref:distal tail protein Dit n=1 Tax=Clostridia TaxID=186801 RepID=UPI003F3DE4B1